MKPAHDILDRQLALHEVLGGALVRSLSKQCVDGLRSMAKQMHSNAFCLALAGEPLASVEPMIVRWRPGIYAMRAEPQKCLLRKAVPLTTYIERLTRYCGYRA